jgi:competence protein ComFC
MADRSFFLAKLSARCIDFLFPPLCIVCDKPRPRSDLWLCEACKSSLLENHDRRDPCPRCAMNLKLGQCACARGWEQPFESAYSVLDFDPAVQSIMHLIKYRNKPRFAKYLGELLAAWVPEELLSDVDALVAVPLYPGRQRKRGYNQSHLLAAGLAVSRAALPVIDGALQRVRDTASQTKLDREERLKNMQGAFRVDAGRAGQVGGKRLLLVDDTITTGATIAAAAKSLLDAGAIAVRVLSIARD